MDESDAPRPEARSGGPTGLRRVDAAVWAVEKAFAHVSAAFIFALMMLGVAQILGRKLLNMPIFGYIDMVELAMTTFAFLAVAYCERLGGHVRMELLLGRLRGRALWAAEVFGVLCALVLVGVLIVYGWEHAMRAYNYGDSTIDAQYPWWPSKLLVPIAFAVLWLRLLVSLVGYLRLLFHPHAEVVAVPEMTSLQQQAVDEARAAALEAREGEAGGKDAAGMAGPR